MLRVAVAFIALLARPDLGGALNWSDYGFDENGNLTDATERKTTATGATVETTLRTFDALDRLKTATLGGQTTTYNYWPDSLPKSAAFGNGINEARCYDAAGRLTTLVTAKTAITSACVVASPLSRYDYGFDANGNRTSQLEQRTNPATQTLGLPENTTYGFDDDDRLVGVRYPDTGALYRLDAVGNRTGERRALASNITALTVAAFAALAPANLTHDITSTFTRADWLSTQTDAKDASRNIALTYDLNGNTTSKTTAASTRTFSWDCRDTLVSVADNGVDLGRYDYDRNLQRVKRTAGAETVEYVLDDKYVLQEADGSQSNHPATRRYHYAAQPLAVSTSSVTSYLNVDALGSVADATSTTGVLSSARQYNAWGEYRNNTAPTPTEPKLGYTGHQFDVESGLVYARARYYDPALGIFLSRDSVEGNLNDAPSLHRFGYAHVNPLRYVDLDGLDVGQAEGLEREYDVSKSLDTAHERGMASTADPDGSVHRVPLVKSDEPAFIQCLKQSGGGGIAGFACGGTLLQRRATEAVVEEAIKLPAPGDLSAKRKLFLAGIGLSDRPRNEAQQTVAAAAARLRDNGASDDQIERYQFIAKMKDDERSAGWSVWAALSFGAQVVGAAPEGMFAKQAVLGPRLIEFEGLEATHMGRHVPRFSSKGAVAEVPGFDQAKLARIEASLKGKVEFKYDAEWLARGGNEAEFHPSSGPRPSTIVLQPQASRAAVIEELVHYGQWQNAQRAGTTSREFSQSLIDTEVQAHEKLLRLKFWTEPERAGLERNLEFWMGRK